MSFTEYTDEQLEKELARRKAKQIIPRMVNEPLNTRPLKEACKEYSEFLYSDDYHEDESDNYQNQIFKAALEMVYGYDVWDYVIEVISS